jgi:hypothetical protein
VKELYSQQTTPFSARLPCTTMPLPDEIFANWHGVIDNDFGKTIGNTFDLLSDDSYVYRAESFGMTLSQIAQQAEKLQYKYQSHGSQIKVKIPLLS